MRFHHLLVILLLLFLLGQPVTGLSGLVPVPPNTQVPSDPNGDGKYEDLNANGRQDFADVVLYFNQMAWIAAHEPVAAFDYNGNSRIDFADVVSLFTKLGSTPTATPTPSVLISQTISPSTEEQVLTGGGITLTIPGGALNATSQVRIATSPRPPAAPAGTSNLTVYEITVGNQTRFYPQLVIEIPYDPSVIPAGADVSDVIRGVWWDEVTGTWKDVPSAVDETRHVVVLTASHLSIQGYTARLKPPPVTEVVTSHFVVHFNPADDAVIASSWGGAFTTAEQLANTVSSELEHAHSVYGAQGYLPPVTSRFRLDGLIHVTIGEYDASQWGWFSKEISVANTPFVNQPTAAKNVAMLQGEMDHELFHAVENAYMDVGSMSGNRWWMEGWADYASTYILGRQSDFPMDAAFFTKPLTTVDAYHEYQIAHFIKGLGQTPIGFVSAKEAWDYTAQPSDSVQSLDLFLRSKGTSLSETYRDFLFREIWTPRCYGEYIDPYIWLNRTWPIDEGLLDGGLFTMGEETHHLERSITIPAEGTTRVWGIDVKGVPLRYVSEEDRSAVWISAQHALPEGVTFTLKSPDGGQSLGQPYCGPEGGALLAIQTFPPNYTSLEPPGTSDHLLYLILTNTGTSDRTILVSVDEPTITATPGELFAEQNVELGVPVVAEHIPSGVDTVRFYQMTGTIGWTFWTENRVQQVDVPVIGGRAETTMYFRSNEEGVGLVLIRVENPEWAGASRLANLIIPVHVRAQGT